jgi:FkbM family methyltransferase
MLPPRILKTIVRRMSEVPSLRPVMGRLISVVASCYLKRPVRVFFDSVWMRQDGRVAVPLKMDLVHGLATIRSWQPNAADKVDVVGGWWFLHYTPKPNDVVIDVGAGMGEDSLLFSRLVGEQGRVYSFEAHPFTFLCLDKALKYSQARNTVAVHAAVFAENGTLQIEDLPVDRWDENSVMCGREAQGGKLIAVPAITLDDFEPIQQHERIQFLKMNIEGAEVDALRGMPKTLAKVEHACIACHDFLADENPRVRTRQTCQRILREAGFQVFETPPDSPPWQRDHLHAVRVL